MCCTSAVLTTYDYFASVGNSTLSRNFESTLNRHKGHRVSSKRHNEVVWPAHLCFLSIILPQQRGTSPNKRKMTKSWKGSGGRDPTCEYIYITNIHEQTWKSNIRDLDYFWPVFLTPVPLDFSILWEITGKKKKKRWVVSLDLMQYGDNVVSPKPSSLVILH